MYRTGNPAAWNQVPSVAENIPVNLAHPPRWRSPPSPVIGEDAMARDCNVVIEMKSARPVSDEDLNAYIDGELPADRRREVERLIATDDAVRVQVESLRRVRELVRLAFTLNKTVSFSIFFSS